MSEHRRWRPGFRGLARPAWLHRPHWTRLEWTVWLSFATMAIAVFGAVIALTALHAANHRADQKQAQANAAVGAATSANASLSKAGLPTIQVPTSAAAPTATVTVTGAQGANGSTGPGPSDAQVAAAVESYCSSHLCSTPPSSSDVASAVAAYCAAHSSCQGATGAKGDAGQNASTDQIAAAVQNYCSANNGCQGPTGPQGDPGPGGATGPEIPSFTFTDELGVTYVCNAPNYQCEPQ